ncbi:MAG: hypothetical protein OXJ62_01340 [Spirochaetaceae bacterium]|nr:hypothetical protein [Spirochaetaceae bacterium]
MAERLVAADASPLIGLAAAGGFDLLRGLFGRLTITNTVRDEVLAGGDLPGAAELAAAIRDGWIEIVHTPAAGPQLRGKVVLTPAARMSRGVPLQEGRGKPQRATIVVHRYSGPIQGTRRMCHRGGSDFQFGSG